MNSYYEVGGKKFDPSKFNDEAKKLFFALVEAKGSINVKEEKIRKLQNDIYLVKKGATAITIELNALITNDALVDESVKDTEDSNE